MLYFELYNIVVNKVTFEGVSGVDRPPGSAAAVGQNKKCSLKLDLAIPPKQTKRNHVNV